jgi:hypothetical protein
MSKYIRLIQKINENIVKLRTETVLEIREQFFDFDDSRRNDISELKDDIRELIYKIDMLESKIDNNRTFSSKEGDNL